MSLQIHSVSSIHYYSDCSKFNYYFSTVTDIRQVNHILRNVNDWQSLGIELGLEYSTLESIRSDKLNVSSECKLATIDAWLRQQDNASTPSWAVLQAALREIGENKAADHIGVSNSMRHTCIRT